MNTATTERTLITITSSVRCVATLGGRPLTDKEYFEFTVPVDPEVLQEEQLTYRFCKRAILSEYTKKITKRMREDPAFCRSLGGLRWTPKIYSMHYICNQD